MITIERTFSGWIESCPFEQRARFAWHEQSTSAYYACRNTQARINDAQAEASTTDDQVRWSVP